ncbi:thermopsin family protease [Sulfolobus tengchongensis]|uniref:Thermopsin family protease n=1 Tax=Sulfolobus tengchongensis TaxID=207809 RepID=A0AAX4L3T1_9CREN
MKKGFILLLLLSSLLPTVILSLPTGIASYNGPIYTNGVLGYANITSLLAYNASATKLEVPPYGASLQLNVMLEVNTTSGQQYYFWLQNVADFITNESIMFFGDNIWNNSSPFSGITNINGSGKIYSTYTIFSHSSYYATGYYEINYSFPFSFYLIINETHTNGGIRINFGYVILQNGNRILPPNPVFFDKVFIPISNIASASIVINNQTTPNISIGLVTYLGNQLDAELVWGGFGNGETTTFLKMSSYLALFYMKDGIWVPFSQVYTYGSDTAESATNLHVNISDSNGDAYVIVGTPNYGLLTNKFTPSIPGFLFLNISSDKVPFLLNDTLTTNFVGYVNSPVRISFYLNYSFNSSSFAILNGNYPSIIKPTYSWFKNFTIIPNYTYYYLVKVNSTIPAIAIINGKEVELNSTNWFKQGTSINVVNYTYYPSNNERFIISSIYPSSTINVTMPLLINISTIKQYKVSINSPVPILLNGKKINGSIWVTEGSNITLSAQIPFYETGKFIGTYNISPNQEITVYQPIVETLELSINIFFIIIITFIIVAILIGIILVARRR